jgi:hypothetical protein
VHGSQATDTLKLCALFIAIFSLYGQIPRCYIGILACGQALYRAAAGSARWRSITLAPARNNVRHTGQKGGAYGGGHCCAPHDCTNLLGALGVVWFFIGFC